MTARQYSEDQIAEAFRRTFFGRGNVSFPSADSTSRADAEAALAAAWEVFSEQLRDQGPLDWLPKVEQGPKG
jgi:hypothetical protein